MDLVILLFLISTFIFGAYVFSAKKEEHKWAGALIYYILVIVIVLVFQ